MKTFRFILLALIPVLAMMAPATGCKNAKTLLPNVSGKAGEVLIVMEKENWEGALGESVRGLLARDCEYLAQAEPLYSLVNVPTGSFADLFKVHRNVVILNVRENGSDSGIDYMKDVWSHPQCVISIKAKTAEEAVALIERDGEKITATIEQAERDRVVTNCRKYEEKSIGASVRGAFGAAPHFPFGYKMKKMTGDFVWVADEKEYSIQGIFVYRFPASEMTEFSLEELISHRNAVLKENVPGMFDGTYMTTGMVVPPTLDFFKYQGKSFARLRGYWEVHNDYMGGPFVSHFFYSGDGKDIIALEAFVYAPRYDKRQYLRQVESILYSWD